MSAADQLYDDNLEILKVIGNRVNAKILTIIKRYPTSPRDLSIELKKNEADIVRRLKKMEKHGLVESKWGKRLDENVKLYSLAANRMNIRFNSEGIDLEFLLTNNNEHLKDKVEEPTIKENTVGSKVHSINLYQDYLDFSLLGIDHSVIAGRQKELGILQNGKSFFFIVGVAGIGKTSLVKRYVTDSLRKDVFKRNGIFWHIFKEVDTLDYLLGKISVFLKNNNVKDLTTYLEKRLQNNAFADNQYYSEAIDITIKSLDNFNNNSIFIFDDFHKVKDKNIINFIQYLQRDDFYLSNSQGNNKVIVISRLQSPFYLNSTHSQEIYVNGLSFEDAKDMISSLSVDMGDEMLTKLWLNFEGTPIALKLFVLFFKEKRDFFPSTLDIDEQISYFQKEVLDNLSDQELDIIRSLSIFRRPIKAEALKRCVNTSNRANSNINSILHSLQKKMLVYRNNNNEFFILECAKKIVYSTLSYPEEAHSSVAQYYLSKETPESIVEALYHLSKSNNTKKIFQILEDESLSQKCDFINEGYASSLLPILDSMKQEYVDRSKIPHFYKLRKKAEEKLNMIDKDTGK